jgi:hypothetical protein
MSQQLSFILPYNILGACMNKESALFRRGVFVSVLHDLDIQWILGRVLHVVDGHGAVHALFSLLKLIVIVLVRIDVGVKHKCEQNWVVPEAQVASNKFIPLISFSFYQ